MDVDRDSQQNASLMERLKRFEGTTLAGPWPARDPVNQPMIRHWCDAVGDANPNYTDPEFAGASPHGGIVAPPTMLQAWTMPGFGGPVRRRGARHEELFGLLDEAGFTSIVATNCEQEYVRYLRPGDLLSVTMTVESISEEKQTSLGSGHFVTQLWTFRDQDDEPVGTMRMRVLKFRPRAAPARAPRPRPGITHDNAFFWEGVRRHELLIQRCAKCGELRHPPAPMCPHCQALEWDAVEASGRGSVYSFVVAHHPPVPPFEYPHVIALVQLEEGTRLVSNVIGIAPEAVRIGMPVAVEFVEVDEDLVLPQFRPVS